MPTTALRFASRLNMANAMPDKPVLILVAAFLLIAIFVNPFHETPIDDDCSYAWTVRHWLDTGEYRLHNWMTVNMPFQTVWGAAFASLIPGFFGALRFSTLPLSLAGLLAFYYLALECRIDRWVALLLTGVLFASYMYFWGTFTFMSDVPALAWTLIALLCFSVALRKQSLGLACVGAAAACAGVLTRQSGVAVPVAVLLAAALDRRRWLLWKEYLLGGTVPLAAYAYQGTLAKNFAVVEYDQQLHDYWAHFGQIPIEGFWRINEVWITVAVLTLPFAAVFLVAQWRRAMSVIRRRGVSVLEATWVLLGLAAVVFTVLYSAAAKDGTLLLPHLLWWYDGYYGGLLQENAGPVNIAVSVVACLAAAAIWPALVRHCNPWRGRPLLRQNWLIETYALCYLGLLVLFVKLLDRYATPLIPVLLLILGRAIQPVLHRRSVAFALAGCVVAVLAVHAIQAGGRLRFQEATWHGCELARAAGIPAGRISGSDEWIVYYAFDDFVAYYRRGGFQGDFFTEYFGTWLPRYFADAEAKVCAPEEHPRGWQVLATVPFRDAFFRPRHVVVLVRRP